MKVLTINVMLVLFLAACTTTGEGTRVGETKVPGSQHVREQQTRFNLSPDDGIVIRQHRLKNPEWKRPVEGWVPDSDSGIHLTAEDARKLKTALVSMLNSSNESDYPRWEVLGMKGRGKVRRVIGWEDEDIEKCPTNRIIFDTAGQDNRYNFEFCQVAEEIWVFTQSRARFTGDDFSDRSARESKNSSQDVGAGTVQTIAE